MKISSSIKMDMLYKALKELYEGVTSGLANEDLALWQTIKVQQPSSERLTEEKREELEMLSMKILMGAKAISVYGSNLSVKEIDYTIMAKKRDELDSAHQEIKNFLKT